MKIMSKIYDQRINSWNVYVESSFGEYLQFAKKIIHNNDLQRKRVKTSKTIYSLLKSDLQQGCIMPPLVLALTEIGVLDPQNPDEEKLLAYINENSENVLILDGLQRTYTLIDADDEMKLKEQKEYEKFLNNKLRLEIYVEINKFGILYRMLTLNTGQTPMSARHQLEMLYSNMLDTEIDGVRLITDKEGKADPDENEFIFKNAIEGFNSYMNRNELPLDRQDILDNVKVLEHMADENIAEDLFKEFLETYIKIFTTLRKITENHVVTEEDLQEYQISESPFGKKVSKIFSSSQALTGFGAAAGKMKDLGIIRSLADFADMLEKLEENNDGYAWMMELLAKLDSIKSSSKKIGNAQRMFFQYFFRELFNTESDSYLNLEDAVQNGYNKYYSQVI
ncbi:hypothetical protein ACTQWG_17700 [Blautia sp. HCP3S3_H10_1]|jgi:hypothetical protein|uniref:hypothetical protein n=1 Tax=unclassified Blautia TaxID=2648079 RepID=UPI003F8E0CED|nr:hypothetical protein [Clostridia bacterium]